MPFRVMIKKTSFSIYCFLFELINEVVYLQIETKIRNIISKCKLRNGYFLMISLNSSGSFVVMKSTPCSVSHFMSSALFTVQAFTFMPSS